MALPSYEAIAADLSIPRCRGILPNGQTCFADHRGAYDSAYVHWRDRTPTRAGIRAFLTLGALRVYYDRRLTGWRRYYLAQRLVGIWQLELGLRFPASVTESYRAQMRAMLVNVPTSDPLRGEALRWATIK